MLEVRALRLDGLYEIRPRRYEDDRGFFSETFSASAMEGAGLASHFVQDNHSHSAAKGVVRGLHFQLPPAAQGKLVRVTRGAVWDVAVDIRPGSPTYGQWEAVTLSAALWNQLFIPEGFAHGFQTLEDGCEVQYKVTAPYSPEHDRSVRYDDAFFGIEWPIEVRESQLSAKDRDAPRLADLSPDVPVS